MIKAAVIGMGRFGMALARQLSLSGAEVIAIDRTTNLINEIKDDVALAVRLDSTDRAALASQNIDKVDVCVICIGENFEAALLTTVIVQKLGVPRIICRAQTEFHAEIFRQIGAHEVIQPEQRAGEHLGRNLANPRFEDFITLAEGFTLIEVRTPTKFAGKTLQELALRRKYGVNLVAIKRPVAVKQGDEIIEQQQVIPVPNPEDIVQPDDVLVLVGSDESLARLPQD